MFSNSWKKLFRENLEHNKRVCELNDEILGSCRNIIDNNKDIICHNERIIVFNNRLITIAFPNKLNVKIKYFDQDIAHIQKISKGDWVDLRSAESVELKAGEYHLIPLGVGMILPDGYEAHVLPRSSTPSKFGIMCANSMGIIDNSYSGDADEWKFPAVAIRDTVIEKGDRIAQFRIVKNQPAIEFEVVEHLNEISRGGIGSTGTR